MPGIVKVQIVAARDLPVMDRASLLTDAFVEVRVGDRVHRTDVCRKSLNPQWNSDWFKFEMDDEELQDEPLMIKVLDHDTYSSHDSIGKVNLPLNSLILKDGTNVFSGWIPIYDTLHGIRGYVNIKVKMDFFSDTNQYRQTSCGVLFFSTSLVPAGYKITSVQGFLEGIITNDDPEYKWYDRIRTPRATNEARQRLFMKMSGQLQRKIGLKALELGGNGVLGYRQFFDLEGDFGIVARGIGTCVLLKLTSPSLRIAAPNEGMFGSMEVDSASAMSPLPRPILRRSRTMSSSSEHDTSIDSDIADGSAGNDKALWLIRSLSVPKYHGIEDLDYPFLTILCPPAGFIKHIGGTVSSRSVKLLTTVGSDEQDMRDQWWTELRSEIRSHMHSLACNAVVGYHEVSTVYEDVVVLSAVGTAVVANNMHTCQGDLRETPVNVEEGSPCMFMIPDEKLPQGTSCSILHPSYMEDSVVFPVKFLKCQVCQSGSVPSILVTTMEPLPELSYNGTGRLIVASACRKRKESKGEAGAEEMSQQIMFLEYELNSQLIAKMKVNGMNSIFALRSQISFGEEYVAAIATGTAFYLTALGSPPVLRLEGAEGVESGNCAKFQEQLEAYTQRSRQHHFIRPMPESIPMQPSPSPTSTDGHRLESAQVEEDRSTEVIVLQLDEDEKKKIEELIDFPIVDGFFLFSTHTTPGLHGFKPHTETVMVMQRWRLAEEENQLSSSFQKIFQEGLKCLLLRLHSRRPCCICRIRFDLDVPSENGLLIALVASVVLMSEEERPCRTSSHPCERHRSSLDAEQLIFPTDEDILVSSDNEASKLPAAIKQRLSARRTYSWDERVMYRPVVLLTPMTFVPSSVVERYLGHINLFFIRESMSLKEDGGVDIFLQTFIAEVLCVVRAHVQFLGGNVLLAFQLNELCLLENVHKNQAQCLFNVSGDVAEIRFPLEDQVDRRSSSPMFPINAPEFSSNFNFSSYKSDFVSGSPL